MCVCRKNAIFQCVSLSTGFTGPNAHTSGNTFDKMDHTKWISIVNQRLYALVSFLLGKTTSIVAENSSFDFLSLQIAKKNWHWIELLKLSILLHAHKCPSSLCIFERFKWSRIIFFVRSFFIFISTSETRAWGCVSQKPWFRVNKFRHCHTIFFFECSIILIWMASNGCCV